MERGLVRDDDPKPAVLTAEQEAAQNRIFAALAKKKAENAAAAAAEAKLSQTVTTKR